MLKERIEARLRALGINQFEAAERTGKGLHFIYDFMVGRKKSFKGDGPVRVAQALECSIEYLTGKSDVPGKPPATGVIFRTPPGDGLPIAGIVEAGVFRRPGAFQLPAERMPLPAFPTYPVDAQVVYVVRGGGLDGRGIAHGMALICAKVDAASEGLRNGAIVVVEHIRRNGKEAELSARELQFYPDRTELHARSKSEDIPPIIIRDGKTGEVGSRARILAVALGALLPL